MVKTFIYLLLALGIGAYLSLLLMADPGYVLINFRSYSIEATFATFVISLLIIYLLIFAVFKTASSVNPLKLFRKELWLKLFFRKNARLQSENGLQLLLLGHWQEAYKNLVQSAERVQIPTFNYLAAAYAAFQRDDQLALTYCLSQAKQNSLSSNQGIKTFQAFMEHCDNKEEQSLALLLAIDQEKPGSPFVLALLKDIYIGLKDWDKLTELLPELEKNKVLGNNDLIQLKERLAIQHFHQLSAKKSTIVEFKALWDGLGKPVQKQELVMEAYLRALLSAGESSEAESILIKSLKRQWSDRLILLLGYIDSSEPGTHLLLLEGWIKDHPKNVYLLLTLGRLSLRNKLWGKAREYFETALRFSNDTTLSAEINAELGRLLEHLGEHEKGLACYRQAMSLMDNKLPELPLPTNPE